MRSDIAIACVVGIALLFLAGCEPAQGENGLPCFSNNTCHAGHDAVWWTHECSARCNLSMRRSGIPCEHCVCVPARRVVAGKAMCGACPACEECPPVGACSYERMLSPAAGILRPCGWPEAGCFRLASPGKTWR